jgi:phage major head subunit gpT-like protein
MSTLTNPVTLERGLRAAFIKAFNNAENPSDVMPFILETTSDGADEAYGWLGQAPSMNEWVDERKLKSLNSFNYKLVNKDYEATLSVDRNALDDDRLGAVQVRINDLATKARIHPRKLFFAALLAGTSELCYDGQPFFSASHVEGDSGTQSNIQTGTGTTLAQLKDDIDAAESKMMGFKDDVGEPVNEGEMSIGIVCHPSMKRKFQELNTSSMISNSDNAMKGRIKTITASTRLTDVNDWYFANIGEGIKPLIRQVRQAPKFSALEATSDNGFMRKQFAYGIDSREVFGYGLWQKMIKVTNV